MNVLVLDHHFGQDIRALLLKNPGHHRVRTVSPLYFARVAERFFPPVVFDADLASYHAADLAAARAGYRRRAFDLLFDLYRLFPFDVFLSPSDTFFYIRDVIDACHELGVPFGVIQKETGVSVASLEKHASELRRWFPFKGDWMTTCSAKSLTFWVASGAAPERVFVVGQPRFDYYRQPEEWPARANGRVPTVLFLSYDWDAYDEGRTLGVVHRPWVDLHAQTESVLRDVAATGKLRVLLKPHPQQSAEMLAGLRSRLGGVAGLSILDGGADTRELIVSADIVVGFQTTALAEAMAAGTRVVYTFWTDAVERVKRQLLPYHELDGCIEVVRSPQECRQALLRPSDAGPSEAQMSERLAFAEQYLGPVDGRAAERTWRVVEEETASFASQGAAARVRARLDAHRVAYASAEGRRARRRAAVRSIAAWAGRVATGEGSRIAGRLAQLRDEAQSRAGECQEAAAGTYGLVGQLVGRDEDNLMALAVRYAARRLVRWVGGGVR